jgi:hypothetical protein
MPLKRSLTLLAVGFAGLFAVGSWWRHQPGGTGTRAMVTIAALVCTDSGFEMRRSTVSDGAQALDGAILRRTLEMLGKHHRRCRSGGRDGERTARIRER